MSDLIESSEFGDWLLAEIARTKVQCKSANPDRAMAANVKLASLQLGCEVLKEFLTLQQAMMDAADVARSRPRRKPSHASNRHTTS